MAKGHALPLSYGTAFTEPTGFEPATVYFQPHSRRISLGTKEFFFSPHPSSLILQKWRVVADLHRVTLGPQPSGVLFALLPDGTEGIRTPTLLIASQTLSQIELRPRKKVFMEWRRQGFGKSTHAVSPVFTTVPRNRRDSHPQCLCGGVFSNVIPQAFFASNCPKFVFVTPRQGSVSVFDLPRGGTTDTMDDPNRGIEPIRRSTSELQAGLPPVPESNQEPPDSFKIPLPSFRQRDEERFFHPSSLKRAR